MHQSSKVHKPRLSNKMICFKKKWMNLKDIDHCILKKHTYKKRFTLLTVSKATKQATKQQQWLRPRAMRFGALP
jgi:hypothetical protein